MHLLDISFENGKEYKYHCVSQCEYGNNVYVPKVQNKRNLLTLFDTSFSYWRFHMCDYTISRNGT